MICFSKTKCCFTLIADHFGFIWPWRDANVGPKACNSTVASQYWAGSSRYVPNPGRHHDSRLGSGLFEKRQCGLLVPPDKTPHLGRSRLRTLGGFRTPSPCCGLRSSKPSCVNHGPNYFDCHAILKRRTSRSRLSF